MALFSAVGAPRTPRGKDVGAVSGATRSGGGLAATFRDLGPPPVSAASSCSGTLRATARTAETNSTVIRSSSLRRSPIGRLPLSVHAAAPILAEVRPETHLERHKNAYFVRLTRPASFVFSFAA